MCHVLQVRELNGAGYGQNTSSEILGECLKMVKDLSQSVLYHSEPVALGIAGMEAITISVPLVSAILIVVLIVIVMAACFVTYQRRVRTKR